MELGKGKLPGNAIEVSSICSSICNNNNSSSSSSSSSGDSSSTIIGEETY